MKILNYDHILDPKFLAVLACPADDNRPPLRQDGDTLVCDQCGRVYPIRDGIPILAARRSHFPSKILLTYGDYSCSLLVPARSELRSFTALISTCSVSVTRTSTAKRF